MANNPENHSATRYTEKCRVNFDDLDAYGMLHAGRYYALVERGIAEYVARLGISLGHEDMFVVAREIKLTFGVPIRSIGDVDLVFWVSHLSRSSATFEFVVTSDAGEHARGYRAITKVDPATGRSAPWTDETRAQFSVGLQDLNATPAMASAGR